MVGDYFEHIEIEQRTPFGGSAAVFVLVEKRTKEVIQTCRDAISAAAWAGTWNRERTMTTASAQRARLDGKRARGECIRCPMPASPGLRMCDDCREVARLKNQAAREKRGLTFVPRPARRAATCGTASNLAEQM